MTEGPESRDGYCCSTGWAYEVTLWAPPTTNRGCGTSRHGQSEHMVCWTEGNMAPRAGGRSGCGLGGVREGAARRTPIARVRHVQSCWPSAQWNSRALEVASGYDRGPGEQGCKAIVATRKLLGDPLDGPTRSLYGPHPPHIQETWVRHVQAWTKRAHGVPDGRKHGTSGPKDRGVTEGRQGGPGQERTGRPRKRRPACPGRRRAAPGGAPPGAARTALQPPPPPPRVLAARAAAAGGGAGPRAAAPRAHYRLRAAPPPRGRTSQLEPPPPRRHRPMQHQRTRGGRTAGGG
jgi:hypothetical protein